MRVPVLQGADVAPGVGVRHSLEKVVAGHSLAVVPLEIEVGPRTKSSLAEQRVVHADNLGSLLVDGEGVEVVDLHVGSRAHGVRHRGGILRELRVSKVPDVACEQNTTSASLPIHALKYL